jgi:stress-induced morphogen
MSRQARIESALRSAFEPQELAIVNESDNHAGGPGRETHFKVLIVADAFGPLGRVDRHRRVQDVLRAELDAGLHALTIRALAPTEFAAGAAQGFVSPDCLGGSKADRPAPASAPEVDRSAADSTVKMPAYVDPDDGDDLDGAVAVDSVAPTRRILDS